MVSFREYLGDVITSATAGAFQARVYPINPGMEQTFPWLAQIANNWQQYKIMGMCFEFRSMSADALNSVNTALGTVVMATNYDALSEPFFSKGEMENSAYAQSIKPSDSCVHMIECDTSTLPLDELYLRSSNAVTGDKRMFDLGFFQIATTGFQGTSVNCGELWVTYQVMLLKPKLYDGTGDDVAFFQCRNITAISNAFPLGSLAGIVLPPFVNGGYPVNTMDVSFTGLGTVVLPPSAIKKAYLITAYWYGNRTANLVKPGLAFTDCDQGTYHFFGPGSGVDSAFQAPDANAASDSTVLIGQWVLVSRGNGFVPKFQFDGTGTLPAATTNISLSIQEIPSNSVDYEATVPVF